VKRGVRKMEIANSLEIKEFKGLTVGFTKFSKFWKKKAITP
jgi:hypothetical protein